MYIFTELIKRTNKNYAVFTSILSKTKKNNILYPKLYFSSSSKEINEDIDQPIKFSTSRAATWSAVQSRIGRKQVDDSPWMEKWSILISLSVFMIYFFILREENDVDKELSKSLYERIEGLEKKQLEISLDYNLEHNIDTKDIKKRLHEIEEEEKAGKVK